MSSERTAAGWLAEAAAAIPDDALDEAETEHGVGDAPPEGIRTRRLADIEPENIRWLWPGRVPLGKVSMMVGDPGVGKSMVTLGMAATVSRGGRWPIPGEGEAPLGDVVLVSAEDGAGDTIRPRLDAAGADCRRVHMLDGVRDAEGRPRPWALDDIDTLDRMLGWLPMPRLTIIDPVSAYLGGDVDSHRNSDIRALLGPLAELAARHGGAIVCVSHLNKSSGQAMYRTTGSLAFTAAARAVYAVGKDDGDPGRRLVLPIKANLAPDATGVAYRIGTTADGVPWIEWEPEPVEGDVDEMLAGPGAGRPDKELREAERWLRDALHEKPALVGELRDDAEAAGHSWRTIKRAKDNLHVISKRIGTVWQWRLPQGGQNSRRPEPGDTNSGTLEPQENQQVDGQGGQGCQNSGSGGNSGTLGDDWEDFRL